MSEKKKKMYVGSGNPNAKSVIYNERVYLTMKDLSKEIGVSMNIVRKMIRNNEVEYTL